MRAMSQHSPRISARPLARSLKADLNVADIGFDGANLSTEMNLIAGGKAMKRYHRLVTQSLVIFLIIPLFFFSLTDVSEGAISYVGDIGSATSKTTGTSLVITTTGAVEAGNDIIIGFATYGDPNYTISIADSAGNTYQETAQAVCYQHGRTYIFAAYNVNGLPGGSSITITHTSVSARAAVASVFSGLAEFNPVDRSLGNPAAGAQQSASGTTPTVGPTGTTTQASELLIGVIGTEGPVEDAAGTWQNSFTAGPRAGTTGGTATSNWTVSMGYRIVSATGAYTAQKSGITSRYWAAAIATFKTENILPPTAYNILLGRPKDTSVGVNAILEQDGEVSFEYGTVPGIYTSGPIGTAAATAGEPVKAVINGLTPNTQYYYRLLFRPSSSDPWLPGNEFSFHTQRAQGSTFVFTITSDSHVNILLGEASTWQQTLSNVGSDHPDFHLDLGDTFAVDDGSTTGGNVASAQEAGEVYLYQRSAGFFERISHSVPIFLTAGNHEQIEGWHLDDGIGPLPVWSINARKRYFLNPVPDAFYDGNTNTDSRIDGDHLLEDYYAWKWGDALFIVLDPFWYTMTKAQNDPSTYGGGEDTEPGTGDRWAWTLGDAQYEWLKATLLANRNAKYKFIFMHHMTGGTEDYIREGAYATPYCEWGGYDEDGTTYSFATRRPGWDAPIHQVLVENKVSALFHGHDHQYAHEERDGVVYQAVPSAGFTGNGFNLYSEIDPLTIRVLPSSGHLRITVSPTVATVNYVRSGGTGGTDTYTIAPAPVNTCQGDFDVDGDVDGKDLASLIAAPAQIEVAIFAANFGKNDCL
jgi:hypothetical protein